MDEIDLPECSHDILSQLVPLEKCTIPRFVIVLWTISELFNSDFSTTIVINSL